MRRELARFLRWGRVPFLRRRLPYVWCVFRGPFRNWWFLATHPDMLRLKFAVQRAVRNRQGIIAA